METLNNETGLSQDTKTIIVVLLLVMMYPVGLVLMLIWMKNWPWWVKFIIEVPVFLFLLMITGIAVVAMLVTIDPAKQINKATDMRMRNNAVNVYGAVERYYVSTGQYPWGNRPGYKSLDISKEDWMGVLLEDRQLSAQVNSIPISDKVRTGTMSISQGTEGVEVCYESKVDLKEVCIP